MRPVTDEALRERIEAAVRARLGGEESVAAVAPLAGGACQDNLRVDLASGRRLVARSDAVRSMPGSLDRAREAAVVAAAAEAGVRTPAVVAVTPDLVREGAGAYLMDWAEGTAIGRKVVADPRLERARAGLAAELARELATIHGITPATHPDLLGPPPGDPVASGLAQLRELVDALPEPRPALELALRWLRDHASAAEEVVLVHGDYRTGNFMVTPDGLAAVLDWEFARWGSPYEDLGWISVRDWRFGRLDRPIGGFAAREDLYRPYAAAAGREVDPARVHYWEVFGNARWAAGSVYQGERYLSGEERDLELVAIARRAPEMEFETLRLIEAGAP